MPPYDHPSVWRASWKLKKDIYGKKHIILTRKKEVWAPYRGATIRKNYTTIRKQRYPIQKRNDTTIEPVCWHPMPLELYDDLIQGFHVKLVYDLVCVDGMVAWASLCRRVGYVGIVFTEKGADAIYDRIFQLMVVHMAEVGHVRYDPQFAAAIGCGADPIKNKKGAKDEEKKPKGKAAAKKKPKGKKGGKKTGDDDDEEPPGSPLVSGDSNLIGMPTYHIQIIAFAN